LTSVVDRDALAESLRRRLPERLLAANLRALDAGVALPTRSVHMRGTAETS
jgi:Pyruvate/2-oxoacid:ferredoxin oxidoreductase gamma subunit